MDRAKSRPVPRISIETDSNSRLSLGKIRDVWSSTKCRLCQKMEFHCRNCKHRCHKKCPGHTHQCVQKTTRRSNSSKIFTGDEHWTKVLQANDVVGGDVVSCPHHSRCHRTESLDASKCLFDSDIGCSSQSIVRSPKSQSTRETSKLSNVAVKDKNFFHSIYSRFCQWIDSTRRDAGCTTSGSLHRLRSSSGLRISRRSSLDSEHVAASHGLPSATEEMTFNLATLLADKAASVNGDPYACRAPSSSYGELGSAGASVSSTCSSLTVTSTSTTTSDCCPSCGAGAGTSSAAMSNCSNLDDGFLSDDVALSGSSVCGNCSKLAAYRQARAEQFFPIGGNDVMKPGWSGISDDSDSWCTGSIDKDDAGKRDCFGGSRVSCYDENFRDSLVDWSIPISDVEIVSCLRRGIKHDVFRGRWHGDVLVYSFHRASEADVEWFLCEVMRLSKIRHENICLFMGACLQPPNLSVITSDLKGISVYDKLHLLPDRIPMRSRVNIGRQVAQAMGYLHAKGITAQVLNSRNIYLEPKVKLSLLDQGMAERNSIRSGEICIPRGSLTYFAPEIMRDFRIGCGDVALFDSYLTTVYTDVFAFGTLLYELFTGQFPFRGLRLEEILYQVCCGRTQVLINMCCNTVLKVLIERCWSVNPQERPPFSDINHELQHKTGLHKRHSSSQPERLDRQNSLTDKCLL